MSIETRMAIPQSTPMPQRPENSASVRYETKFFSLWDRKASAEVAHACMYEIAETGTAVLAEFPVLRQQARLKSLVAVQVFRVTTVKGTLWQQQRNRPTGRSWTRDSGVRRRAILRMRCGRRSWGRTRPCKRLSSSIKCSVPGCALQGAQSEICYFWGRPVQARRALSRPQLKFCSAIAER